MSGVKRFRVAVLPGDGIGAEVMPEAIRVLDAVAAKHGFALDYRHFDWSCATYAKTGRMMPVDGIEQLRPHDAILLGAVGFPGVPDHISLWGLLIPIRREFDQYVNLRPVRLLPGVRSPLRDAKPDYRGGREANPPSGRDRRRPIDYWVVRENTEGEYSQVGGRFGEGDAETAIQVATFTRRGVDRILRYAFELSRRLGRPHVTSATKSNGITISMPFWDERFRAVAADYPDVRTDQYHIDILAARFVMSPERFDVVVASNLFGDILSDLGPGTTGTLGLAPSGNIDPTRRHPSMFEPVHGSAPDIAGRGIANPIAQIWAGAMLLEHLGETAAAAEIVAAIERVLGAADSPRTPDLGGRATTADLGKAVAAAIA